VPDAPIEIVDYDPSWTGRFATEAAMLRALLPGLEWHHIGSTAVVGLAAKPIIDIMAWTDDLQAPITPLVEQGGYQYPAAFNATLTARRWFCRPTAQHRTHHLHLVSERAELARHLRFRDALREDAGLSEEYAALKRCLAMELTEDREAYTAAKAPFIERVLGADAGLPRP
jgi:GrpB-like predicted nucleotidyltransferase (UPF0157 family)